MRGTDERSGTLFSYVDLETRVPKDHSLRVIREIVNAALCDLSADFAAMYAPLGRPSIAPEKLLRALLLQAFYTIRSERQMMERLQFDLLFRWFVGLGIDDAVWDHSVFSKNRNRLLEGDVAARFMAAVLTQPNVRQLLSTDHFSVDGTLVEAWASMKSLKPKNEDRDPPASGGRNEEVNFRGEKRSNQTHASTSDPDAMLYRKGSGMEAKLCYIGHTLMENRNGLLVDARLTRGGSSSPPPTSSGCWPPARSRSAWAAKGLGGKTPDQTDFNQPMPEAENHPETAGDPFRSAEPPLASSAMAEDDYAFPGHHLGRDSF